MIPLWKPNESELIKTKPKKTIFLIHGTFDIYIYIYSQKAASLDPLEPLIKIQRSGANIPSAKINGFTTNQSVDSCHSNVLCEARVTGILWLPRTLILRGGWGVALIGQALWSMSNVNSSSKNPAKLCPDCRRRTRRAKVPAVKHYTAEYISS